jgi:hypothetical protein
MTLIERLFNNIRKCVAIIPTLLLISSCMSQEGIRSRAIEHEYEGPINNAIGSFVEAYYRLPSSLEELSDYCKNYSQNHPGEITFIDHFINQMGGNTPWDYFSKHYVSFASYTDSCFLYDRKHKYGCCFYGSTCYWANSDWRKARSFSPSFIDKEGEVINVAHIDIDKELVRVRNQFENMVLRIENADSIPVRFREQSLSLSGNDTTAYNLVLKFSKDNGVKQVCDQKYYKGPLMSVSKTGVVSSLYKDIDLDSLSRQYRDSLAHSICRLVSENDDIDELLFIVPLVY